MIKPNLIIAGVTKGGTTSLFSYLADHPQVESSSIKETCYFLPLRYNEPVKPMVEYQNFFGHCKGSTAYVMEATPGYFYSRDIPHKIHQELGDIKIIIVLRDPTKRMVSFYKYMKSMIRLPKDLTFKEYIAMCEKYIADTHNDSYEKQNDFPLRGISDGFYSDYIMEWFNVFGDNVKIVFFEDLLKDQVKFMQDICGWLDIDPAMYTNYQFEIENKTALYKNKFLHTIGMSINRKLEVFFRRYLFLKRFLRKIYFLFNEDHTREDIAETDIQYIEKIYQPYNKKLYDILKTRNYSYFPGWIRKSIQN